MRIIILFFLAIINIPLMGSEDNGLIPIVIDDKLGYIKASGDTIIQPQFDVTLRDFTIIAKDQRLKAFKFPDNVYFHEGIAAFQKTKYLWFIPISTRFGYIDIYGNVIIQPQYISAEPFHEGAAKVKEPSSILSNGLLFSWDSEIFIDKNGNELFTPNYSFVGNFREGLCPAMKDEKYGYINKKNQFVIEPKFNIAYHFSEGLACVYNGNKFGFIDKTGKLVIDTLYARTWSFKEGYARVYDGKNYHFIDKNGDNPTKQSYEFLSDFSEGLALFSKNGKFGYIDHKGNEVIAPIYKKATPFSNGLAKVSEDVLYGFIAEWGQYIIEPQFQYAEDFRNDAALVWKDGTAFYINKKGDVIFEFEKEQVILRF